MEKVIYETRGRIAYDEETNALLWHSFEAFRDDPEIDVAIVTGTGDSFCAGADLKTFIPAWMNASAWRVPGWPWRWCSRRSRSMPSSPEGVPAGHVEGRERSQPGAAGSRAGQGYSNRL